MKRYAFLLSALLLTACSTPKYQPVITFIGIGTGTLATDVNNIKFQDRFGLKDHDLIAVVAFSTISDGTQIQATWHSPDDRSPPLGRKVITTESGATVARFTLANSVDWTPAPFLLDIYVTAGEGENALTATGQTQFYMGMTDKQVADYKEEFQEWKSQEAERQAALKVQQEQEDTLLGQIRENLGAPEAGVLARYDLTGDGQPEYFIVDPMPEFPMGAAGALMSADATNFAIADSKGAVLAKVTGQGHEATIVTGSSAANDTFTFGDTFNVQASTGGTLLIKGADCTVTLVLKDGTFKEESRDCAE